MELVITPNSAKTALFSLQYDRKMTEMLGNTWKRMKNNSGEIRHSSVPLPFLQCQLWATSVQRRVFWNSSLESGNGSRTNSQRN